MAKIVGLGGVFLQFKGEEKEVQHWYQTFFELDMSEFGTGFIEGNQLLLLSFSREKKDGPYINFRVDDIDSLFRKISANDLKIIHEIKEYEYGKFGQFQDPFGNIIELWEPYENEYKKMVLREIENYKKNKLS